MVFVHIHNLLQILGFHNINPLCLILRIILPLLILWCRDAFLLSGGWLDLLQRSRYTLVFPWLMLFWCGISGFKGQIDAKCFTWVIFLYSGILYRCMKNRVLVTFLLLDHLPALFNKVDHRVFWFNAWIPGCWMWYCQRHD